MEIVIMTTAELVPDSENAKEHTPAQVEEIAASIRAFGFNDPIGVWHDAEGRAIVVEGNGRLQAARALGIERVPTVSLDHLTADERKLYGLAHNTTNMASGLDMNVLAIDLDEIKTIDMGQWFEMPVREDLFGDTFALPDDDGPQVKTMTIHPTAEQLQAIRAYLNDIPLDTCELRGPSDTGDKLCQAALMALGAAR